MKNLAGVETCDFNIEKELTQAGFEIIPMESTNSEVPYTIGGKIGNNTVFTRAWYYWCVECIVPLDIANIMYHHSDGKTDIRVAGHCGCPPPSEWLDGGNVTTYHIDTQKGLNLFSLTIKRHSL
jgi:hypothetical protein